MTNPILTPGQVDALDRLAHTFEAISPAPMLRLIASHRALGKLMDEQMATNRELSERIKELGGVVMQLSPTPLLDSGGNRP